MKVSYLLFLAITIVSCQRSEQAHHHDDGAMESDSTNTILYNQVMDIHDEVMPKMEDLYNLKKDLQSRSEAAPSADEKQKLDQQIAAIDSASNLMMDWMHEFNPPADTVDQEQIRAYLESEMVKVKQVKEAILTVLSDQPKN